LPAPSFGAIAADLEGDGARFQQRDRDNRVAVAWLMLEELQQLEENLALSSREEKRGKERHADRE
jgi:hypothetical protein